jgi:hypothetical protein
MERIDRAVFAICYHVWHRISPTVVLSAGIPSSSPTDSRVPQCLAIYRIDPGQNWIGLGRIH